MYIESTSTHRHRNVCNLYIVRPFQLYNDVFIMLHLQKLERGKWLTLIRRLKREDIFGVSLVV